MMERMECDMLEQLQDYEKLYKKPLSESLSRIIVRQILDTVMSMHGLGYIHRDLKLENILCSRGDNWSRIRVADFGACEKLDSNGLVYGVVGTRGYMAPEVLVGAYDEKIDVWGIGLVMYMMLFLCEPFDNGSEVLSLEHVDAGDDWMPVSDEAKDLLSKALERDPKKRISPKEFLAHKWMNIEDPLSSQLPPTVSAVIPLPSTSDDKQETIAPIDKKSVLVAVEMHSSDSSEILLDQDTTDQLVIVSGKPDEVKDAGIVSNEVAASASLIDDTQCEITTSRNESKMMRRRSFSAPSSPFIFKRRNSAGLRYHHRTKSLESFTIGLVGLPDTPTVTTRAIPLVPALEDVEKKDVEEEKSITHSDPIDENIKEIPVLTHPLTTHLSSPMASLRPSLSHTPEMPFNSPPLPISRTSSRSSGSVSSSHFYISKPIPSPLSKHPSTSSQFSSSFSIPSTSGIFNSTSNSPRRRTASPLSRTEYIERFIPGPTPQIETKQQQRLSRQQQEEFCRSRKGRLVRSSHRINQKGEGIFSSHCLLVIAEKKGKSGVAMLDAIYNTLSNSLLSWAHSSIITSSIQTLKKIWSNSDNGESEEERKNEADIILESQQQNIKSSNNVKVDFI